MARFSLLIFTLLAALGCGSDYSIDDSFTWGFGGTGSNSVQANGIIGSGTEGWQTGELSAWGSSDQFFNHPQSVAVDAPGNIYVTDYDNHRVCKWGIGRVLPRLDWGRDGRVAIRGSPGGGGSDNRSFYYPSGVCVDESGNIYVSDLWNCRISKWDSGGNFIGWIGGGFSGWQTGAAPGGNNGYGWVNACHGLCVDHDGSIYVCDQNNHRVCKWDASGRPLGWIGWASSSDFGWQAGSGATSNSSWSGFDSPSGVAVDRVGNIFVVDTYNHRISRWDKYGYPLGWCGQNSNGWQWGSSSASGNGPQEFANPHNVAIDGAGNMYVADSNNNRIAKWNHEGFSQGWIGAGVSTWSQAYGADAWTLSSGFIYPMDVALGNTGEIYIADQNNHRISRWQQSSVSPIGPDSSPPEPIDDFTMSPGPNNGEITLTWSAPNDMGGRAFAYDLRYAAISIDDDVAFNQALNTHMAYIPGTPGSLTTYAVGSLAEGNEYYFRIRSIDAAGNVSAMSNQASGLPLGGGTTDSQAPDQITDLMATQGPMAGQLSLTWTAPSDDGLGVYPVSFVDIRFSLSLIATSQDWNDALRFSSLEATGPGTPRNLILDLTPGATYYVIIRTYDEAHNPSPMSIMASATTQP